MIPHDLQGLPKKTRNHFRAMLEFDHDEALKLMASRHKKRESMTLQELITDFQYAPELVPAL